MREWMHELESGNNSKNDTNLSGDELKNYKASAVDGSYNGSVQHDNEDLTNSELASRIESRIREEKPVARLLEEYKNRLEE